MVYDGHATVLPKHQGPHLTHVSSTRSKGKQGITVGADLATGCAERKAIFAL